MTKSNRKSNGIGKRRYSRAVLLIVAVLLTVTAAGCFGKPSKQTGNPTGAPTGEATPEPTKEAELTPTPEPSPTPESTPTPEPTPTPTPSGTAFTPSATGGRVTFTGNTAEVSKANVGDTVRFGSYEQDNDTTNGAEAIEWLVLDKQDGKLLLLSKDALDCKKYNETYTDVTWETCTLRGWLNGTFYTTAFSQTEQGRIATTKVRNEDNPGFGTEGGNDTEDKVFLLSIGEAARYFGPDPDVYDPACRAKVTAYAKAQGGWTSSDFGYVGNGCWWLRSPGSYSGLAADVDVSGGVFRGGDYVSLYGAVVRPAFWLNLES